MLPGLGDDAGRSTIDGRVMSRSLVRWPADCRPEGAPVYAYNTLEIPAAPERIWGWLIRAELWPDWYANARDVRIDGERRELAPGARFTWTTFGVRVTTVIEEFEPYARLAWRGSGLGASGYHGWVIQPLGAACRVVTEETQRGFVPWLGQRLLRRGLQIQHQRWLEGLARQSLSGPAPDR
jgi:hypothetical protein